MEKKGERKRRMREGETGIEGETIEGKERENVRRGRKKRSERKRKVENSP